MAFGPINTDYDKDNPSGHKLDDLTYDFSMTSTTSATMAAFDLINAENPGLSRVQWDHAIGDNDTGNGAGTSISNGSDDAAGYAALIGANNVAQNSWKAVWFLSGYNPNTPGDYVFTLKAYDGATELASTSMTVTVVPLPGAALLGFGMLGGMFVVRRIRRRR